MCKIRLVLHEVSAQQCGPSHSFMKDGPRAKKIENHWFMTILS